MKTVNYKRFAVFLINEYFQKYSLTFSILRVIISMNKI